LQGETLGQRRGGATFQRPIEGQRDPQGLQILQEAFGGFQRRDAVIGPGIGIDRSTGLFSSNVRDNRGVTETKPVRPCAPPLTRARRPDMRAA
jgi:hypothetical protein